MVQGMPRRNNRHNINLPVYDELNQSGRFWKNISCHCLTFPRYPLFSKQIMRVSPNQPPMSVCVTSTFLQYQNKKWYSSFLHLTVIWDCFKYSIKVRILGKKSEKNTSLKPNYKNPRCRVCCRQWGFATFRGL